MIEFAFDEQRAAQAATRLLERHGRPMPVRKLATLLYLADRRSFVEAGYPITGDRFVNTADGPSLERISALAGCAPDADSAWGRRISSNGSAATTFRRREPDQLSTYWTELLDGVHDEFASLSAEALAGQARCLPEWREPADGVSAVDLRAILEAEGIAPKDITEYAEIAATQMAIHRAFAR